MPIILATEKDFAAVKEIVHTTIDAVYPRYYPSGAVSFFKKHHNDENLINDINKEIVYLLVNDNLTIGTVTIKENEICRLFVLPEYQHKGYGKLLLDFAEGKIAEHYSFIELDASLSAKKIYLSRGYKDIEYNQILTDNGDYLCYDFMQKSLDK